VRITQRVIQLVLLGALGLFASLALAGAGTPQWKDTGPVTKKTLAVGSPRPSLRPRRMRKIPITRGRTVLPSTTVRPETWRKPGIGASVNTGGGRRLSRGIDLLTGRNQP
jgi:hypothetical protein